MDIGDDMSLSAGGGITKRACEACRTRKVRCDRSVPCSNCVTSGLACTPAAPTQKAQKERVHISQKYEKKIDNIEDRLSGIESVLETLAAKLDTLKIQNEPTERTTQARPNRTTTSRAPASVADVATPSPFEGETAIASQSDYAREFLAQTIGSTPAFGQDANIQSALSALKHLVSQQGQVNTPMIPSLHRCSEDDVGDSPTGLQLPPWDVVSDVLDKATKFPATAFALFHPFLWMPNLKQIMRDAYDNPEQCGAGRRLFTYGVLYTLFTNYDAPWIGVTTEDIDTYSTMIEANIDAVMNQIDISLPASYEHILALHSGAIRAIESCKPSLCWLMTSVAAGMCQSLGYHRISTMQNDSEEERSAKVQIFWMIYTLDKSLSLSLGRASVIQDWDISLPMVAPSKKGFPGSGMHTYWIKVAQVQGQTYEKLFSPAAFLRPAEERARTAAELVNAMNQAWEERSEAITLDITGSGQFEGFRGYCADPSLRKSVPYGPNETELPSKRMQRLWQQPFFKDLKMSESILETFECAEDLLFHSDALIHYSTCALIQRAVSPDNITFNQDCLESSRAALAAHMRCNSQFNVEGSEQTWTDYMHWSVLSAPITPFIVIFCNAIQHADPTDLPALSVFVESFESCRETSEGAEKLYKICYLFLNIAKLYIQAKPQGTLHPSQSAPYGNPGEYYATPESTGHEMNTMTPFDPYLSALGLVPNSSWPTDSFANAPPAGTVGMGGFSHGMGSNAARLDTSALGYARHGEAQQSAQDWFWGSRYLINLVEAGDDLQMPDFHM